MPEITPFPELNLNFIGKLIQFLTDGGTKAGDALRNRTDLAVTSETNSPEQVILTNTQQNTNITRILDAFPYKVPDFEALCDLIIEDPNKLARYLNQSLKMLMDYLLNPQRTALNNDIIEAIGRENYHAILAQRTSQDTAEANLALELIQAVLISFGQRTLDHVLQKQTSGQPDQEAHSSKEDVVSQLAVNPEVTCLIQILMRNMTLQKGLDESALYRPSYDELKENIEVLRRLLAPINIYDDTLSTAFDQLMLEPYETMTEKHKEVHRIHRYNAAYQSYNEVLQKLKITPEALEQIKITPEALEQIKKISQLIALLEEAGRLNIKITEDSDDDIIQSKLIPSLKTAIEQQIQGSEEESRELYSSVVKELEQSYQDIEKNITPEKRHWFIRLVRWITQNDRLLENKEEKKYQEQYRPVKIGLQGLFSKKPAEAGIPVPREEEDHRRMSL